MKRCAGCKVEKPLDAFNASKRRSDGLQTTCRDCCKERAKAHYQAQPSYYREKAGRHRREVSEEIRKVKNGPCVDCGGTFHHAAMDFDHRDPESKVGSIATLIRTAGWALERVLEEVSKCDLVCANCHRVRSFNRQGGKSPKKSSKKFR